MRIAHTSPFELGEPPTTTSELARGARLSSRAAAIPEEGQSLDRALLPACSARVQTLKQKHFCSEPSHFIIAVTFQFSFINLLHESMLSLTPVLSAICLSATSQSSHIPFATLHSLYRFLSNKTSS